MPLINWFLFFFLFFLEYHSGIGHRASMRCNRCIISISVFDYFVLCTRHLIDRFIKSIEIYVIPVYTVSSPRIRMHT